MPICTKLLVNNNAIYFPFTKRIISLVINPVKDSVRNSIASSIVNSRICSAAD